MIFHILNKLGLSEKKIPRIVGGPLFRYWWKNHRGDAPKDLVIMMDYLVDSPSFSALSPYWIYLARKNIGQIISQGLDNFKQTVARHYFVIADWKRSYYYENLLKFMGEDEIADLARSAPKYAILNMEASRSYYVFTTLLLRYVRKLPSADRYLALSEPNIGNPATIDCNGKPVSSDLLNSILDFDSIFNSIPEEDVGTVLEVGGGYGRNAYCNISLLPKLRRYIMVDIPPALFLAQSYISKIFPDKKVFKFRPFASFEEIENEFNECELAFLLPEQIEMLPPKVVDLIIAIDCLHEMDKSQVTKYFRQFDRLGHNFYFKCWQKTDDNFYQEGEYPISERWKEIINRHTVVPARYFEAFYEIPNNDAAGSIRNPRSTHSRN